MPHAASQPDSSLVKNDLLRCILICCGWLAIACGVVGIFLPLLPTVPFLLLAAACFARSSLRFHTWLVEHNHLGPLVRDYLESGAMPLRAKRMALGMIWVSVPASAFLLVDIGWIRITMLAAAGAVSLYLLSLPAVSAPLNDVQTAKRNREP